MPTVNKYHKEDMVTIKTSTGEIQIPRSKAVQKLKEIQHEGKSLVLSSDRVYLRTETGQIIGTKPKMTKAERKAKNKEYREMRRSPIKPEGVE